MDGHSIVYPDVAEYWHLLDHAGIPHVILTYGDQEWQEDKVFAGGWRGTTIVTDTADKGAFIAGCVDEEGATRFKLNISHPDGSTETIHFNHAVLVDDKAGAFASAPEDTSGVVMWREAPSNKQRAPIPAHLIGQVILMGGLVRVGVHQGRL